MEHLTQSDLILQRWRVIQYELIPDLRHEVGGLSPKLEKLIHLLEWVRIEEFLKASWRGEGRPPYERAWLANAFVAKVVLGIPTTAGLIERLMIDRALRRLCDFPLNRRLPSAATFSRAFAEFAQARLAERVHESLVREHLGDRLIGHLCRDGTAIEARERPAAKGAEPRVTTSPPAGLIPAAAQEAAPAPAVIEPRRQRGRPRKGEPRPAAPESPLARQRGQTLAQMREELPTACDRGSKCNAQGYKNSWNGYKLHIDTADCGVPIAALLSSASMHDSRAAIPLSLLSEGRVTHCYDLMDAAYCSAELRDHCRCLGHVPLIDHNPRRGEKIPFAPHEARRYNERTVSERINGRLKDEFGGNRVYVRGAVKVMSHLMFGIRVLAADQLMRLLQ